MTGPTRRRLLAGCGVGLTALAGCSGFPGLGGDETPDRPGYDREELVRALGDPDEVYPPDTFPVAVPAALQNRHRERARRYLDDVPTAPSLPNEAVATKLADERSDALEGLEDDAWGRPRHRLETWRQRRVEAATVRGSYLAATGDIDGQDVADARDRVRSTLASFDADWTYRATDPVAAAVVHGTLEKYVEASRTRLYDRSSFPDDPGEAVFEAGEVVGDVDAAAAAVVDAGRLREQYRRAVDDADSHRHHLAAVAQSLERSLSQTTDDLRPYVEGDPDVFDRDLRGTPARHLFRAVARLVEWRSDEAEQARRRHAPASAVLETGRALVAAGALEAVVDAVRDGRYQTHPTVADVEAARQRSLDALETAWRATPQPLAVELSERAVLSLRGAAQTVDRGYHGPAEALAHVVTAEAQARAVPAATAFVAERVRAQRAGD